MKRCTKTAAIKEAISIYKQLLHQATDRFEKLGMPHAHDLWDVYDSMERSLSAERNKSILRIIINWSDRPKKGKTKLP